MHTRDVRCKTSIPKTKVSVVTVADQGRDPWPTRDVPGAGRASWPMTTPRGPRRKRPPFGITKHRILASDADGSRPGTSAVSRATGRKPPRTPSCYMAVKHRAGVLPQNLLGAVATANDPPGLRACGLPAERKLSPRIAKPTLPGRARTLRTSRARRRPGTKAPVQGQRGWAGRFRSSAWADQGTYQGFHGRDALSKREAAA